MRQIPEFQRKLPYLADISLVADGAKDDQLAQQTLNGVQHLRAALERRDIAVPLAVFEADQ